MQPKTTSYNDIFLLLELETWFRTPILNIHSRVYLAWRQLFLTDGIDLVE
jgi:hypothetical protein